VTSAPCLRILSIAHCAVSRQAGRLRYHPLAARSDLEVHLLVPRRWHEYGRMIDADPPDDPGLRVHVLPILLPRAGPMNWYLHFYPGLRRLIRQIRPDVIHLWEEPWSAVALQASLLSGNAAVVMEVDQNIIKRLPPPFEAIRRHVLRRTDHVLSRHQEATSVVRAKGYQGPVSAIGYGVNRDIFSPAGEADRAGPPRRGLRLGYVGRVLEEKGLDEALDAIVRARSPVSLAIMGEGAHEARLRQRVAELGLETRVTFQPWRPPAEVAHFIRGLDVLILLSRSTKKWREQFGRVILEAQSCGVPVIGTKSGAIPDVIGPGGWIVPERDPVALAHCLDAIASQPDDELRNRGLAGQKNVASRFTFEIVAQSLAQAWSEAAGTRRGRTR
jgi:glycosyltransferase involved in cell wall biosynthesis